MNPSPAPDRASEVLAPIRRVFVSVGETSGDIHAANLIRAAREIRPEVQFEGFGGPRMEAAGCRLHENIIHLASMGVSWIQNVFAFLGLVRRVFKLLRDDPPDAFLLVDMPGFNFILARMARWHDVPVVYYICPQIWAWAPWRRGKILRLTRLLMVILPFEEEYYRSPDHEVLFVGHPLADSLVGMPSAGELEAELRERLGIDPSRRLIALFPGSRDQEVQHLLPYFRSILEHMRLDPAESSVLVSCCRPEFREPIESCMEGYPVPVQIVEGDAHPLMASCELALVASGTATLELAYYEKPMLVLYRVHPVHHFFFRLVCTSPFIALVNILGGEEIVPEEIGHSDTSYARARIARELLEDTPRRRQCLDGLARLKRDFFQTGASRRAAETLVDFLDRLD